MRPSAIARVKSWSAPLNLGDCHEAMLYADLADTPPAGHRPAKHVGVRYENRGAYRRYADPADLLSRQREVDPRSMDGAVRCRTDAGTPRGASGEADMNEER